jgi:hypothetical protein
MISFENKKSIVLSFYEVVFHSCGIHVDNVDVLFYHLCVQSIQLIIATLLYHLLKSFCYCAFSFINSTPGIT